MDVLTDPICRHASCGCRPRPEHQPYCSAYCGNVVRAAQSDVRDGETVGACSCGHAECEERLRRTSTTPDPPLDAEDAVVRRAPAVGHDDRDG
jgi:hypothetical protein